MSVLVGLLENPMSLGGPGHRGPGWRQERRSVRVLLVAVVAVLSLMTTWSMRVLFSPTAQPGTRDALVEQVDDVQSRVDEAADTVATLQAQVDDLEAAGNALLPAEEQTRALQLAVATGAVAVTGPGLRVTLADAADAGSGRNDEGRVQDSDLQAVVDALWAAGAEAIAVNGHRLGATSAIRSAGQAVLVDLEPVASPYTVEAIGEPGWLETGLEDSEAGALLVALNRQYSITSGTEEAEDLELEATALAEPRYVGRAS